MAVYVQGASALAYYRTGNAPDDIQQCSANVRNLKGASSSKAELANVGVWRLGIGEPSCERPLEVLVRSAGQRSRLRAIRARVWSGDVPRTAFRQAGKELYVSSPEFVFLQMAPKLGLPQLVAPGMELCGTYRRNVELAHIDSNECGFETAYHVQPLTTPKRLRGFLDSVGSGTGRSAALNALKYVLPNSASPMETVLYLLLCLPRRLGGYALPLPALNPSIVLSRSGRKHTLRSVARPDLFWRLFHLDLEYDSEEFHGVDRIANDSMRRKALERMGIEVIQITTDELRSTSLFHATAMRLARRLGKRVRSEFEGGFSEQRALLRESLLEEDPTRPLPLGNRSKHCEESVDSYGYDSGPSSALDGGWEDEGIPMDDYFLDDLCLRRGLEF